MIIYAEVCTFCKHLDRPTKNGRQYNYKCSAFPEGVPREIYSGRYDHRNPYPNDLGIRFEIDENHKDKHSLVKKVFNFIEEERRKLIDGPMYINPMPYYWWKTQSDDYEK